MAFVAFGSSFIDVDHFIAAGSFSFDKAMHAPHRGPFHSTGLFLIIFLIWHKFRPHQALLFLISFLPHHLRDAQRRGIYLFPPAYMGWETAPLPKALVRVLIPLFPWAVISLRDKFGLGIDKVEGQLPKVWTA